VRTFCGLGGFFKCGRPHFSAQKTSNFLKFMVCTHDKGEGLSQCGHFSDKREGVNFSRFCVDVFYGRCLITEVEITNTALLFSKFCNS